MDGVFEHGSLVYHVETPRLFISLHLPYTVMLQDFLWEIYEVFLKFS